MKRMKVSSEEEEMILKFRCEKKIYNAGVEAAAEHCEKRALGDHSVLADEIRLLKKEI